MYLFVYIFLMLAVIGLFADAYLLQASRMWARQKAVGEIMNIWHTSAYALAKEEAANLGVTFPCRLSPSALPTGVLACQRTLQNPANPVMAPYGRHYLPAGYQYTSVPLRFPSIVYVSGGVRYLATYVPKETEGNTSWLGYTAREIFEQIQQTDVPSLSFGQTANGTCNGTNAYWFMTNAYQDATKICYPAPANIPAGSVGFISPL